MKSIILGSRGSDLALWQANHVRKQLESFGHEVEIKIIITQGDAIQDLSFDKLEGKGFFTKEIEKELLDGTIDLAVHSHKDLETTSPEGLMIAAVSERESPSELLLMSKTAFDSAHKLEIKANAIVGTSSARRKSILLSKRTDLEIKDLRGNVPTRIEKLRQGLYDGILLAKAGVDRLQIDLSEFHVNELNPHDFVPAPAQGVLGLQIRSNDERMKTILSHLHHPEVSACIELERTVLKRLEGGCQLPLGVYCPTTSSMYVSHSPSAHVAAIVRNYEGDIAGSLDLILSDLRSNGNDEV